MSMSMELIRNWCDRVGLAFVLTRWFVYLPLTLMNLTTSNKQMGEGYTSKSQVNVAGGSMLQAKIAERYSSQIDLDEASQILLDERTSVQKYRKFYSLLKFAHTQLQVYLILLMVSEILNLSMRESYKNYAPFNIPDDVMLLPSG